MKILTISLFLLVLFSFSCTKTEEPCSEKTWYIDADNDGKGDKNESFRACEAPIGYVSNADDDNDIKTTEVVVPIIPLKGFSTPLTYANMKLVWADEFSGTSLNESNWNYELGNNNGWGNNELQIYKKENTEVKEGNLLITAKKESGQYTSSRLTTQNKFNVKYGRIDIRAALPKGQGIWPALWMLGKNFNEVGWPRCGEIDIMEMVGGDAPGRDNTTHGTVHWDNGGSYASYGGKTSLPSGIFNGEYHVFSLVWDSKKISWLLDDKEYHAIDITPSGLSEFQNEFFLILNVAVGGNWPGSPDNSITFPQYMVVDYIRVFQ